MVTTRKLIGKNKFTSCIPIISGNEMALFKEIENVESRCDFIEWRRDYFRPGEILTVNEEIAILKKLNNDKPDHGIIYTFRSHCQGGACETPDNVRLEAIGSAARLADYVDVELKSDPVFLKNVKERLKNTGCRLILSHHDFKKTPKAKEIAEVFNAMEDQGADVFKLAVKSMKKADVRQLISASLMKNESTAKPIIAIAMGTLGGITRIAPDLFGGSLTYVAGIGKTAPGQLTLEEIIVLRKSLGLQSWPDFDKT